MQEVTRRVHCAELAPGCNGKGLHRGVRLQPVRDQLMHGRVQAGVYRLCQLQYAPHTQCVTAFQCYNVRVMLLLCQTYVISTGSVLE